MNIPDLISPILAYRTWQWDASGLRSLNSELWPVGKPLTAHIERCELRHANYHANYWLNDELPDGSRSFRPLEPEHIAPAQDCSCGIYAAKNFQHLVNIGYAGAGNDYGVHGEVYLWGKVWDHELGYRAQYAYPKNLTLTFNGLPWSMKEIEKRLITLTKYNVDIFLQPTIDDDDRTDIADDRGERLLLWSAETGFNPRAFASVMEDRAHWYAFKEARRMVPGETLAVLGYGIGIIRQVDDDKSEVHVQMFNRELHKIEGQYIQFSKQNYRWESSSRGTVTGAAPWVWFLA